MENVWQLNAGFPALDVEFESQAPWAEWDWIAPLGYQMAADGGAPPATTVPLRMLTGVGL